MKLPLWAQAAVERWLDRLTPGSVTINFDGQAVRLVEVKEQIREPKDPLSKEF